MQIERRKFLTSACKACLLAGAGFLISDLTACSPSTKIIRLPIMQDAVRFPAASFATESIQIVRPAGWYYDIAVRKTGADQYEALLLECTHQQNQLVVSPNGFKCNLHGSQFNLNGEVVKGPAERALRKFSASLDQDQVVIQLKSQKVKNENHNNYIRYNIIRLNRMSQGSGIRYQSTGFRQPGIGRDTGFYQ
jgi:nitrite reductase/ring-hydroxylating ferredoxin subunit